MDAFIRYDFQDTVRQRNYEDQFKLIKVTEENLADISELIYTRSS